MHNGVCLNGSVVGTVVLTGRGAGQDPTASSVISDLVDVVKVTNGISSMPQYSMLQPINVSPLHRKKLQGGLSSLAVDDRPGQLAKVADCLADRISLATVSQTPHENEEPASLILTTHQPMNIQLHRQFRVEDLPGVVDEPVLFGCLILTEFPNMNVVVQKYGGTSVADVDRIKVARRIKSMVQAGSGVVVVVSARAGVTNQLIDRAKAIRKILQERTRYI